MLHESTQQVIRCWLMARIDWGPLEALDEPTLRAFLLRKEQEINGLSSSELVAMVQGEAAQEIGHRLLQWSWRRELIPLKDFGPWKTVGDALPFEACCESAVEAARFVSSYLNTLPKPQSPNQQRCYACHVRRIQALQRFAPVVRDCPLMSILVAEKDQRGRGGCKPLRFSSEDGSHRAIAMVLAGYDSIAAWVGNPCP